MPPLRYRAPRRGASISFLVSAVALAGLSVVPAAGAHAAAPATSGSPHAKRQTGTVCTGSTCVATFEYSGSSTTFTVPAAVTSIVISASGAEGGSPAGGSQQGSAGGKGGTVAGTASVTPGDVFTVLVGAQGAASGNNSFAFGGGGASGNNATLAGGGGGGSFVFSAEGVPVVVGGGGGGGTSLPSTPGGAGGGASGAAGSGTVGFGRTGSPAGGGTQSAGGAGGTNIANPTQNATATAGSAGTGTAYPALGTGGRGNLIDDDGTNPAYNGAGGGGGFYGGGGGASRSSGAGGSGYASADLTGVTSTSGTRSGAGLVTFTWTKAATATSLVASPASPTTLGTNVTLTASVSASAATSSRSARRAAPSVTGVVDFTDGSTAISGCQDVALSSGTATCTLQPTAGDHTFKATLDSSANQSYATSTSTVAHTVINPVTISTSTIAGATVGQSFDAALAASNGTTPYTWSLEAGSLPDGVQLTAAGHISGTPTEDGTFPITVEVTDAAASSDLQQLSLVVAKGTFTVGAPTITGGPATIGSPLTCSAPTGTPGTASFAWSAGSAHLAGGASYTPVSGDVGMPLTCSMTVTRAGYTTATNSATTDAVVRRDFTVGAPVITGGPARVGARLTCASPSGTPGTASFAWLADQVSVADGASYTPLPNDLGKVLTCVMSVARPDYNTATSASSTAPVAQGSSGIAAPTITGTAQYGEVLTCTAAPGTLGRVSFAWFRGTTRLADAAEYVVGVDDVGAILTCVMTVMVDGYEDATNSASTEAVALAPADSYTVTVAGRTRVGRLLRATISPDPTSAPRTGSRGPDAEVRWQWFADGRAIPGATRASFRATYAQVGARLVATATVLRPGFETPTAASARTARVALRRVLFTATSSRVDAGKVVTVTIGRLKKGQRWAIALDGDRVLRRGRVAADGRSFTVAIRIPARTVTGQHRLVLTVGRHLTRSLRIQVR